MVGRAETGLLGQRQAQDHARLAVVGKVLTGCGIDQGIEVGQAAQGFAGDGNGQRGVLRRQFDLLGRGIERPALAKHGIEHIQGGAARTEAFDLRHR